MAIAGSTGSIGMQALEVIEAEPDRFSVAALGAGSSVDELVEQAQRWRPAVVAIADDSLAADAAGAGARRAPRSSPGPTRWRRIATPATCA